MCGLSGRGALVPGGVREQLNECAAMGVRAVQLDAAGAETRARGLDRSARRDLAGLLRRLGLALSGLDLWITPSHFTDAAYADRAVSAVEGAAALAAELSTLVGTTAGAPPSGRLVCVTLPAECPAGVVAHLDSACQVNGVVLADHVWPARASVGSVRCGIDPGAMIFAGADPVIEVARLKHAPAAARLTDMASTGRVEPGSASGRLEREAYEAALRTRGFSGHLVLDLRGLLDIRGAVRRLTEA